MCYKGGTGNPQTVVRKVLLDGRKVRTGIYDKDGRPLTGNVESGKEYMAKIAGRLIPVIAGGRQILYPAEDDMEDPRIRTTRAEMLARGFDLDSGTYRADTPVRHRGTEPATQEQKIPWQRKERSPYFVR